MTPAGVVGNRRRIGILLGAALAVVAAVAAVSLRGRQARLTGQTPQERVESVCRLADEKPWGAAEVLARAATEEPHPDVRRAAVGALASFATPECRSAVEAGTRDVDRAVRAAAATTLGLYEDDAAAERLAAMVAGDADESVRLGAVQGLGRSDRPKAVAGLLAAIETNDNKRVRLAALAKLLHRLKAEIPDPPDPMREPAKWRRIVEILHRTPAVKRALQEAQQAEKGSAS